MSDVIYGKNSFMEALQSKRIIKAYLLTDELVDELKQKRIPYEIVNRRVLDKMSGSGNHQGYLAEVKEYKLSRIEDMIKEKDGLIVVLDGLKDVHNLGAIVRTVDCVGADGIIYKKHGSVKVNDTVAKVASGALEYVKIAEVTNLVNTLRYLKDEGYWIVGTDASAKQLYTDIDYKMNTVIVIGSEGEGISRLVLKECDYVVSLPLRGHVNSLNASVATGVVLFNVLASRSK